MNTDFQGQDFVNWAESIDFRPRSTYRPQSVVDLASFVRAAQQNDRRVRAVGSAWAFPDVAISHDYLVDTTSFGAVLGMSSGSTVWGYVEHTKGGSQVIQPSSPVLVQALTQDTIASGKHLVHAQAGVQLRHLCEILDSPEYPLGQTTRSRWALRGMGGAAGQTLAGVVSTSAHGGDFNSPPYPGMVCAIDIVMADGQRYWIERSDRPITSLAAITAAFANDPLPPIVHYDTDEFLSVLVSFGSMGIICSLVIEVGEQFALSQQVGWSSWSVVRQALADRTLFKMNPPYPGISVDAHPTSGLDAQGDPYDASDAVPWGLEVIVDPYRSSDNYFTDLHPDRDVLVVCRAMSPFANPAPPPAPSGAPCFWDQLEIINNFKAGNATSARGPVNATVGAFRVGSNGFFTSYLITDTYDYSKTPQNRQTQPLLSIEMVLPTGGGRELAFVDSLLQQFDAIIAANLDDKFAGVFSLRYCQTSEAYLSMHNFRPEELDDGWVCNIEIGCLHNVDALGNRIYGDEDMVGLKDGNTCESAGQKHFLAFEQLVNQSGARLHWGQMSFTNSHNPQLYPQFELWRTVRDRYSQNGTVRVFESDFTTRYQISDSVTSQNWTVVTHGLLPGAPTTAPAEAALLAAKMPPTAFLTTQNCLEVVVIGSDGQVCWTRKPAPNTDVLHWSWVQRPDSRVDNNQSGNVTVAPQLSGRVAVGMNQGDSHPEVFALSDSDTGIYHAWRNLTDNTWNNWTQLKGDTGFSGSPDVAQATDGVLVVVALDSANHVRWTSQNNILGVVGWNDWSNLPDAPPGSVFIGDPFIVRNGDGLIEVFISSSAIWGIKQTQRNGSSGWGNWVMIGQLAMSGSPAAGINADGALELFAVHPSGQLYHIRQTAADAASGTSFNWDQSQWEPVMQGDSLSISASDRPSVVTVGGAIHVAALTTDGSIVHYEQQGVGYVQHLLGGHFTSAPCIVPNTDGHLEVFVKFANDLVEQQSLESSGFSIFGAWQINANGSEGQLNLHFVDSSAGIVHIQGTAIFFDQPGVVDKVTGSWDDAARVITFVRGPDNPVSQTYAGFLGDNHPSQHLILAGWFTESDIPPNAPRTQFGWFAEKFS